MFSTQYVYPCLTLRTPLQEGFSLLETLAAVSIFGVIITLAIPQFRAHTSGLALRHEAATLQTFLELGAAYALTARTTIEVTAARESISVAHPDGTIIATHRVRHNASLDFLKSSSLPLYFYPAISASPATLVLTKNGYVCSVIISLRGRVRTECE